MKSLSDVFSPDVLAEMSRPFEPLDPRNAEIIEGKQPKWFVVEVYASEQDDVATELAKHRFGVYVPVVDETIIRRGRRIDRRVPLISGYIFVFMWFSAQHWRWIADTPGVVAVLGWVEDREIDRVRMAENGEQFVAEDRSAANERALRKAVKKRVGSSRRKKRGRKAKANGKTKRAA